jgi:hypothetical protein
MMMETKEEYMKEAKEELGDKEFSDFYVGLDNEFYSMVEKQAKQGKAISEKVYNSLSEGQRFHFNKHYNYRGDMIHNGK